VHSRHAAPRKPATIGALTSTLVFLAFLARVRNKAGGQSDTAHHGNDSQNVLSFS